MINATFTLSGTDFDTALVEKIKNLLNGNGKNFEIFIHVKAKETRTEMRERIETSMEDVENGQNLIEFSPEAYENLLQTLSAK